MQGPEIWPLMLLFDPKVVTKTNFWEFWNENVLSCQPLI